MGISHPTKKNPVFYGDFFGISGFFTRDFFGNLKSRSPGFRDFLIHHKIKNPDPESPGSGFGIRDPEKIPSQSQLWPRRISQMAIAANFRLLKQKIINELESKWFKMDGFWKWCDISSWEFLILFLALWCPSINYLWFVNAASVRDFFILKNFFLSLENWTMITQVFISFICKRTEITNAEKLFCEKNYILSW